MMSFPRDETQLIRRIRAGEHQVFRALVDAHQGRVFRVCLNLLGDRARAEDLSQDTFVRAYQKLDQFDTSKGKFGVWLVTIARRLCLNALKKVTPFPMAEPPEHSEPGAEGPDDTMTRLETFRSLDAALANLSDEHRRVFVFAEIEELSHDDIACIEGVAVGTVKSRLSRSKQILRESLQATFEELKGTTYENEPKRSLLRMAGGEA